MATTITTEQLQQRMIPDPSNPDGTFLLTGIIGNSNQTGTIRLFFDPAMNFYLDIPSAGIIQSQSLNFNPGMMGHSLVWIKKDTQFNFQNASSPNNQNQQGYNYFEGELYTAYLKNQPAQQNSPYGYPQNQNLVQPYQQPNWQGNNVNQ